MTEQEKQRERDRRRKEKAKHAYAALISCYPFGLEDLDGEVWKDVIGYDNYQVSNYGRVKSFKKGKTNILKPTLIKDYLGVDLYTGGKKNRQKIHIIVAKAFIQNPQKKPEVNHDDGNKFNCYVGNLFWATKSENQQHAARTGLHPSGEDNYQAGVTNEQARYIRLNPNNLSVRELGKMFGMSKTQISKIQLGKTYQSAGGTIRGKIDHRIPDEIRAQIRADWTTGNYSINALARKYGYAWSTIRRILNEEG